MLCADPAALPLPRRAQLEPAGPDSAPALMSFEAFRALIDEYPGLEELQLQGAGEPLAHPRFFEMAAYAAARGVEVTTTTTLLALSDARMAECLASGLARIDVAPGAAPADCEYLRPGSKLRRALRNVRRLAAEKRRLGLARPRIRLVLMLLRRDRGRLAELVRLAAGAGADALAFQHLWHDVTGARRFVEAESLLGEPVDFTAARASAAELGIELEAPRERRPGTGRRCEEPWHGVHIGASGEALPCAMLKTRQRLDLGSMRRDGIVRVWNNDAYREFRRRLDSDNPPEVCRRCAIYQGVT